MPSDTAPMMTPEEVEAIRLECRELMDREDLSSMAVAKESGIVYGTFSPWIGGNYKGRTDRIAVEVRKWLRSRVIRQQTQALAPTAPRFVSTPTAEDFMAVLAHAQHMPDFAVVAGAPGVGKTSAACHYTRITPNVYKITAHPMLKSPRALLDELSRTIGAHQGGGHHRVQRGIINKLRGTGALLMVDEAQHLSSEALDQLRSIHDDAEIGIVLIGNVKVFGRLEGEGRRTEFAQLFSRVGMRVSKARSVKGDIDAILDAWGVEGAQERALLHAIGRKPGALRSITKTLKLAHMRAVTERQPLDAQHIRDAYAQLSSQDLAREDA